MTRFQAQHSVETMPVGFGLRRRLRRAGPAALIAGCVAAVLLLVAVFGPWLAPQDPLALDLASAYQGPSAAHWFGTDANGRDLLSRLIVGARTSLLSPLLVIALASLLGGAAGIASAWMGGAVDDILSRLFDVIFAIPGLLLAILAAAVFGNGLTAPIVALALANTPYFARLIRSAAMREVSLPYVAAGKIAGMSSLRITLRHVLPNISGFAVAQASVSFGYAMVDLAMVSFLGLGVQPPSPDWGLMIANGETGLLRGYPIEAVFAGLLIIISVISFNILGERLDTQTNRRNS